MTTEHKPTSGRDESMVSSRPRVIFTPHSDECYLADQERVEYIVYDGFENRDRAGRKYVDNRGDWWHRFKCNCVDCDSVALVRWEGLMQWIAGHSGL